MNIILYRILFFMMLIGFFGLSVGGIDLKSKFIGILLAIVNGLIFWK